VFRVKYLFAAGACKVSAEVPETDTGIPEAMNISNSRTLSFLLAAAHGYKLELDLRNLAPWYENSSFDIFHSRLIKADPVTEVTEGNGQ
jgi:hypothetical protein